MRYIPGTIDLDQIASVVVNTLYNKQLPSNKPYNVVTIRKVDHWVRPANIVVYFASTGSFTKRDIINGLTERINKLIAQYRGVMRIQNNSSAFLLIESDAPFVPIISSSAKEIESSHVTILFSPGETLFYTAFMSSFGLPDYVSAFGCIFVDENAVLNSSKYSIAPPMAHDVKKHYRIISGMTIEHEASERRYLPVWRFFTNFVRFACAPRVHMYNTEQIHATHFMWNGAPLAPRRIPAWRPKCHAASALVYNGNPFYILQNGKKGTVRTLGSEIEAGSINTLRCFFSNAQLYDDYYLVDFYRTNRFVECDDINELRKTHPDALEVATDIDEKLLDYIYEFSITSYGIIHKVVYRGKLYLIYCDLFGKKYPITPPEMHFMETTFYDKIYSGKYVRAPEVVMVRDVVEKVNDEFEFVNLRNMNDNPGTYSNTYHEVFKELLDLRKANGATFDKSYAYYVVDMKKPLCVAVSPIYLENIIPAIKLSNLLNMEFITSVQRLPITLKQAFPKTNHLHAIIHEMMDSNLHVKIDYVGDDKNMPENLRMRHYIITPSYVIVRFGISMEDVHKFALTGRKIVFLNFREEMIKHVNIYDKLEA